MSINPRMLALLEKARLFSFPHNHFNAKAVVNPGNYRFFLPNCFFNSKDSEDIKAREFESMVRNFIKRYLDTWLTIAEVEAKVPFDWQSYTNDAIDFFGRFNAKGARDVFEKVVSGENAASIAVFPNSSKFIVQRIGNILAFNVEHVRSKTAGHVTGRRAVEMLCRAENTNNNQGVYEIIHEVKLSLPLPKERTEERNGGVIVDFGTILDLLRDVLRDFDIEHNVPSVANCYWERKRRGVIIGKYCGLNIWANIIHTETEDSASKIWRQGNMKLTSGSEYSFWNGEDLFLELSLRSSLPESSFDEQLELDFDAHNQQFIIAEAGAIFASQLCSMNLANWRRARAKMGD